VISWKGSGSGLSWSNKGSMPSFAWHASDSTTQEGHKLLIMLLSQLISFNSYVTRSTQRCSWLRHCTTSWKVMGSVFHGVTGIFHWHKPSGCTMVIGSTQLLHEMSTRNISWGVKAAGAS